MVEQIAPELVQRMVAHMREIEEQHRSSRPAEGSNFAKQLAEIRAIVADLPEPIDPDRAAAVAMARKHGWGQVSTESNIADVLTEAIKYGRSLARTDQEPAHG